MTQVLMVCTGNIYRSTIAHQVLAGVIEAAGLDAQIHIDSAGGSDEERGNPIDRRVVRVLRENGHDTSNHYAHQVGLHELGERDLTLVMTGHHLTALNRLRDRAGLRGQNRLDLRLFRDSDPQARPGDMSLPDPWYGDYFDFVGTLKVIERTTPAVLEHLRGLRGAQGL